MQDKTLRPRSHYDSDDGKSLRSRSRQQLKNARGHTYYQRWTPCCCTVLADYRFATRLCQLTRVSRVYSSLYLRHECFFRSQQADRRPFLTRSRRFSSRSPVCQSLSRAVRSFLFDIWLSWDSSMHIWLDTSFVAVVILGSNGATTSTVRLWHDNEYNGHTDKGLSSGSTHRPERPPLTGRK